MNELLIGQRYVVKEKWHDKGLILLWFVSATRNGKYRCKNASAIGIGSKDRVDAAQESLAEKCGLFHNPKPLTTLRRF